MNSEIPLIDDSDARRWASEFVALHGGDKGLMLAWFANAICTGDRLGYQRGYDDGQRDTSHALMGLS